MMDSERPSSDLPPDLPPPRGAPLDPASLDRLCDQTHRLADGCDEPILQVHYWATFLDIYLESGIHAPVYEEDGLLGLIDALSRDGLDLCDPLLPGQLRTLADSLSMSGNEVLDRFRDALARHEAHEVSIPSLLAEAKDDLRTGIVLVMQARPLWRRPPVMGIPETLVVRASRGFVAPGQIAWQGRLVPGDAIQKIAQDSLAAAIGFQGFDRARLSYEIAIGRPQLPLMGSSLGLALAALMASFEAAARRKSLPIPRPDVVLCGAVDSYGVVLPVSPRTLRQKVRAATGAGFRSFVLPAENAEDAAHELEDLGAALPGRILPALVPVRYVRDVWSNPAIVETPVPTVRSRVRRRRSFPTAVAILGVLMAILGVLLLRPRWNDPQGITTKYQDATRRNVVTRVDDFPPREKVWKFKTVVGCAIDADLSPVSRSALLAGTTVDGPDPSQLYCYDIASGRLLWSKDFAHPAGMGAGFYKDNQIMVVGIAVGDLDQDGRQDIVVTLHANPHSPCFVVWLLADGTQKAIYGHQGYLVDTKIVDFHESGQPVALMTGTLNTSDKPYSQSATVVALDAKHFSGWPAGGYFAGAGTAPFDSSLAQVIFPPIPEDCAINDVPGYMLKYFAVSPSASDPRIVVAVGRGLEDPGFVVTLDGSFHPISIVPEDGLAAVVDRAVRSGRIQADFTTPERLQQYLKEIRRVR
jgi:hypothetical protein